MSALWACLVADNKVLCCKLQHNVMSAVPQVLSSFPLTENRFANGYERVTCKYLNQSCVLDLKCLFQAAMLIQLSGSAHFAMVYCWE